MQFAEELRPEKKIVGLLVSFVEPETDRTVIGERVARYLEFGIRIDADLLKLRSAQTHSYATSLAE